jgi:hypothetical protein
MFDWIHDRLPPRPVNPGQLLEGGLQSPSIACSTAKEPRSPQGEAAAGLPLVTRPRKSVITFFAAPSFYDGSGSDRAWAREMFFANLILRSL